MSYTTSDLGLKLPDPATNQQWQTSVYRSNLELLEQLIEQDRSTLLQQAAGIAKGSIPYGTTAERNAYAGSLSTAALRVAFSKKLPLWRNSETGTIERYYAAIADAGRDADLSAKASGWFSGAVGLLIADGGAFNSIPGTGVWTAVGGGWAFAQQQDVSYSTGVFTVRIPGFYQINYSLTFPAQATAVGQRAIRLLISGKTNNVQSPGQVPYPDAAIATTVNLSTAVYLAVDQTVTLQAFVSGGTAKVPVAGHDGSHADIIWIREK